MNRQIGYLRDDVKTIIENQAELQTIVFRLARPEVKGTSISNLQAHIEPTPIETRHSMGGVEENVTARLAR